MTTIYVAYKRIRFDVDEVIGMFLDRDRAEQAIAEYLIKVKDQRQFDTVDDMLFQLAASFEVDTWETDSIARQENYGLTDTFIKELIQKIEKQWIS